MQYIKGKYLTTVASLNLFSPHCAAGPSFSAEQRLITFHVIQSLRDDLKGLVELDLFMCVSVKNALL